MPRDLGYHALEVAGVVDETADARTFVLAIPPALEARFSYVAGQFCTFRASIADEPVVRCYSMSSSPDVGERFAVTVKRVPGGVMSNWMNDTLAPGHTIEAMPPAGRFVLRDTGAPLVAFAGGSGITPVLSILKSALATTARRVHVVYANRTTEAVLFGTEIERLRASSAGRLTVHSHVDAERGFLDAARCAALAGEHAHADFYVCGPAPFMEVVEEGLSTLGVESEQRFLERFTLPPDDSEQRETEESSTTETLVLRLDRRKHTLRYQAGDTILEAARRAGLRPPFSCEAGSCATCMARLDAGSVKMRVNNALSAAEVEQGWILTCQALPTSPEVSVNYDS